MSLQALYKMDATFEDNSIVVAGRSNISAVFYVMKLLTDHIDADVRGVSLHTDKRDLKVCSCYNITCHQFAVRGNVSFDI